MTKAPPARPWSLWSIAALITSAFLVPPLCLLGPVLGFIGIADTARRGRRGLPVAVAGIVIGLTATGGWLALGRFWHVHVRTPMIDGPIEPLRAGLGGDVAAFRAAFARDPGEAEAGAFLARVRDRYGAVRSMEPWTPEDAPRVSPGDIDVSAPVITYRVRFDRAEVTAEARFLTWSDGGLPMILRWGRLWLRDAALGDLSYPADPAEDQDHGSVDEP